MTTRPAEELTLADRLSHLTYAQACRILGPRAKDLLRAGGICEIDVDEQVRLDAERFVLELPDARVSIELEGGERVGLACHCSTCTAPCAHAGSALALRISLIVSTQIGDREPGGIARHARGGLDGRTGRILPCSTPSRSS